MKIRRWGVYQTYGAAESEVMTRHFSKKVAQATATWMNGKYIARNLPIKYEARRIPDGR